MPLDFDQRVECLTSRRPLAPVSPDLITLAEMRDQLFAEIEGRAELFLGRLLGPL